MSNGFIFQRSAVAKALMGTVRRNALGSGLGKHLALGMRPNIAVFLVNELMPFARLVARILKPVQT